MKLYHLKRIQRLPVSLETAWQFFSSPHNLNAITPAWLNLRLTHPVPAAMHAGMLIRYRVTAIPGLPLTWVTEITHVERPAFFVDEQRFGPYRFWHHQHRFDAVNGGTEMTDVVHYALRWGPIGGLLQGWWVHRRLAAIFDYRRQILARRFPAPAAATLS
ncbi:MAG: SRPBCC family protein [Desulfosarcinaceae bacterium]|nr:SRPBCC family protein [Desulfosarcinaceae bacterium]